jgi:hypothetical protein
LLIPNLACFATWCTAPTQPLQAAPASHTNDAVSHAISCPLTPDSFPPPSVEPSCSVQGSVTIRSSSDEYMHKSIIRVWRSSYTVSDGLMARSRSVAGVSRVRDRAGVHDLPCVLLSLFNLLQHSSTAGSWVRATISIVPTTCSPSVVVVQPRCTFQASSINAKKITVGEKSSLCVKMYRRIITLETSPCPIMNPNANAKPIHKTRSLARYAKTEKTPDQKPL